MAERSNYLKIGLFVISAIVLITLGAIFFGGGYFLQESVTAETYFNETVQGLEKGSPVKMRGVQIGTVSGLYFANRLYPEEAPLRLSDIRYVLVRMALDRAVFGNRTNEQIRDLMAREAARGMRARLALQGITGLVYLEIDYVDPERFPPLPITWEPEVVYIPSAPSTLSRIGERAEQVMEIVEEADIPELLGNLNETLGAMSDAFGRLEVEPIQDEFEALIAEMRTTNQRIRELLDQRELETIPEDVAATAASARAVAEETQARIGPAFDNIDEVSASLVETSKEFRELLADEAIRQSLNNLAESSENFRRAAEQMPDAIAAMAQAAGRIDDLVSAQETNMDVVLENLRVISENLRTLSADLRRSPSQVLFGDPPPRAEPRKRD